MMRSSAGWAWVGVALVSALSVGCLGGGHVPSTHHYVLEPPAPQIQATAGRYHLGVDTLEVEPPYDQDRLVYRSGAGGPEVGFYNYHRWASPLGRLLASSLATVLRGAPGVASAEPVAAGREYDAVLSGRVVRIEEIEFPDRSEARVELGLTLESGHGEILWRGTLEGRSSGRALDGGDAMDLVQVAFGEVARELRRTVAAALRELDES